MEWYLLLLIFTADYDSTLFGQYQTKAECQAELEPLKAADQPWACLRQDQLPQAGWVNGPSAGSWAGLTDEFNEKAQRVFGPIANSICGVTTWPRAP